MARPSLFLTCNFWSYSLNWRLFKTLYLQVQFVDVIISAALSLNTGCAYRELLPISSKVFSPAPKQLLQTLVSSICCCMKCFSRQLLKSLSLKSLSTVKFRHWALAATATVLGVGVHFTLKREISILHCLLGVLGKLCVCCLNFISSFPPIIKLLIFMLVVKSY